MDTDHSVNNESLPAEPATRTRRPDDRASEIAQAGVPVHTYGPMQVKQALVALQPTAA